MREDHARPTDDQVVDLGAATARTLGLWDPVLKENHETPESLPM